MVCWVGSTFHRWDLPLHASRMAFRVLSSILDENASATTIWWPFSENTDAFHFKPVTIQLCSHNLLPFVLNGYSFTCAATILRPFPFVVTLQFFGSSCSCAATSSWLFHKCKKRRYSPCSSILLYFPRQYLSNAVAHRWSNLVAQWSKMVKAVKNGQIE